MVAHPDDCVIFGYPLIANSQAEWHICYLTYTPESDRAQEISKFWNKRNVSTEFLGCVDLWEDTVKQKLHFDTEFYKNAIQQKVSEYDLVLTHYQDGDYGHIHHKFVHEAVKTVPVPQVYFASDFNDNLNVVIPIQSYGLDELPMHCDVIAGFETRNVGRYIVTPQAKPLLRISHRIAHKYKDDLQQ